MNRDPVKNATAYDLVVEQYRKRAADGDTRALVELGDLLHQTDPEGARAAYQQAVDAGDLRALFDLALLTRRVTGDNDAALAIYRQAVAAGDPAIAAEALYNIVLEQLSAGDSAATDAALQQVIDAGQPRWAAHAMIRVASRRSQDDPAAAEALYRQAIDTGDVHWSAYAGVELAELLEARGDVTGPPLASIDYPQDPA